MSSRTEEGFSFAVCLSHDVDRLYKTYQYVWNALVDRNPRQLAGLVSAKNPYWTFERIMDIESGLGVRSSFNVLDEMPLAKRPKTEWLTKDGWKLFAGRYDIDEPAVASAFRAIDRFGWEIGLHGSYTSSENPARFAAEKSRIESSVGTHIIGNRQHYWKLSRPDTWRHLKSAGIKYDTSLGSSNAVGFQHGYDLIRPFDDEFVVFPWSMMDGAVMNAGETPDEILAVCEEVLERAREHRSVLVLDWHGGDAFSRGDYPGWGRMYERIVERALEMGAWIGPPGDLYEALSHPDGTVEETLSQLSMEDYTLHPPERGAPLEQSVNDD